MIQELKPTDFDFSTFFSYFEELKKDRPSGWL
jgi:hypothetical protein